MSGVEACIGIGVQNPGWRNPPVQDWGETFLKSVTRRYSIQFVNHALQRTHIQIERCVLLRFPERYALLYFLRGRNGGIGISRIGHRVPNNLIG
jgi:hypothetical protein